LIFCTVSSCAEKVHLPNFAQQRLCGSGFDESGRAVLSKALAQVLQW